MEQPFQSERLFRHEWETSPIGGVFAESASENFLVSKILAYKWIALTPGRLRVDHRHRHRALALIQVAPFDTGLKPHAPAAILVARIHSLRGGGGMPETNNMLLSILHTLWPEQSV